MLTACGPTRGAAPSDTLALERLAFVPRGQMSVALPGSGPQLYEIREPLLVDMFEVTRGEWMLYANEHKPVAELAAYAATWSSSRADLPATFVTQREAEEFARWRGMRLLRAGEWLVCAIGPQRLAYPWGSTAQRSIANTLELGLERVAPVGTFEAGRTANYVYDMLGNAAEWSADLAPTADTLVGDERASVLGGSFRNLSRPIIDLRPTEGQSALFTRSVARDSRADDVGLRCCAEAEAWLWDHTRELDERTDLSLRLVAVGRRWGRRALPLLDELAARPNAPRALSALAQGARQ